MSTSVRARRPASKKTAEAAPASKPATPAKPPKKAAKLPTPRKAAEATVKPAAKAAAQAAAAPKAPKKPKVQLVRDGFTMPADDFALIAQLKKQAAAAGRETKKSELLRAGLQALAALETPALLAALTGLAPVKIGRPRKGH